MNDQNENPEEDQNQQEQSPPPQDGTFDDLGASFRKAVNEGVEDAKTAAKDVLPKAKEEINKGVHDIAYGVSYALSFGLTIAREFTPDLVANAFHEGSEAGRKAATEFAEKQRESRPTSDSPSNDENSSPGLLV